MNGKKKGFTLIELLVVVLIIGILAAIALPQYQKAVLKSRYTTLMPIAKGIAEGNEAYFMEHGVYAEDPTELPIKGQESYPDGTTLDLQDTDEYTYVLASRVDLPGLHHIIYQHHSKNFPSETHCEAAKDNKLANWVCKDAFKGTKLGGSLTEGYNTYLLNGSGNGITATALAGMTCADGVDENLCKVTTNADGTKTKKECGSPTNAADCTWTTFNLDGTKTICDAHVATYENGVCQGVYESPDPYEVTKDEDGEVLEKKWCITQGINGSLACSAIKSTAFQGDGGYLEKKLDCNGLNQNINYQTGKCANGADPSAVDSIYDSHERKLSERTCATSNAFAPCTEYSTGTEYTREYDSTGQEIYTLEQTCSSYIGSVCSNAINEQASRALQDEGDGVAMIGKDANGDFWYEVMYPYPSDPAMRCTGPVDWVNVTCPTN